MDYCQNLTDIREEKCPTPMNFSHSVASKGRKILRNFYEIHNEEAQTHYETMT